MVRKTLVFGISMVIICLSLVGCKVHELSGLGSFEGLDPEIELQIIKTYFGEDYKGQKSINQEMIKDYLGTYGDCIAIRLDGWKFGVAQSLEIIDKIVFVHLNGLDIDIWKDNKLYSLTQAYDQGFLTKNDLEEINVRDKELYPELYALNEERIKDLLERYNEQVNE